MTKKGNEYEQKKWEEKNYWIITAKKLVSKYKLCTIHKTYVRTFYTSFCTLISILEWAWLLQWTKIIPISNEILFVRNMPKNKIKIKKYWRQKSIAKWFMVYFGI